MKNDVIPAADGGYLMAGFTFSNDGGVSGLHGSPGNWADVWIVKIDAQRNIQWQKCLGGTDADAAYRVIELSGGNIIIAASTHSTNGDITLSQGNRDIRIIKLDGLGNTDIWLLKLDTAETTSPLSTSAAPFDNIKVGPLPFTDELTIDLGRIRSSLRVEIISILGEIIVSIHQPISLVLNINTSKWKSGQYLLKISNKNQYTIRKLIKF